MSDAVKKNIRDALITLGIEDKRIYSLVELEAVAMMTDYPLIAVMGYLRNRRKGGVSDDYV